MFSEELNSLVTSSKILTLIEDSLFLKRGAVWQLPHKIETLIKDNLKTIILKFTYKE